MVILHVKRGEKKNEFLYETTVSNGVKDMIDELVEVHNLRLKCIRTAMFVKELATHGPIRPEETRGLSDEVGKMSELDVNAYGKPSNPDEHGYRTGCPPPQGTAEVMIRCAEEADAAVSHTLVASRKSVDKATMERHLENLKGAVMIAFPAYHRLPAYDPARLELENKEELDGRSENQDVLDPEDTVLWFAGKEVNRSATLSDVVGRNEKTKVVVKLCPKNAGAPVRESRIDDQTHKAMLSYYYKKQEESKKLLEDDDDSYLESSWANPKALKNALVTGGSGSGDIKWKAR